MLWHHGVLGTTGIETLEVLRGIVDSVKPKALIVIDSLASKSIGRISSSIQLADTGIAPGAGVYNKRKELSDRTMRNTSNCNWSTNGSRYQLMITKKNLYIDSHKMASYIVFRYNETM